MRKISLFILSLVLITLPQAVYAQESSQIVELKKQAKEWVAAVESIDVEGQESSLKQKQLQVRTMLNECLYFDWMAQYSLGRHKRFCTEEKLKEFVSIYKQFVLRSATKLFLSYEIDKIDIKNIRLIDDNLYTVETQIILNDNPEPTNMIYLVHQVGPASYKIGDIITEGVSVISSQKSEFHSIIVSYPEIADGIDQLISNLKKAIAENKSKS